MGRSTLFPAETAFERIASLSVTNKVKIEFDAETKVFQVTLSKRGETKKKFISQSLIMAIADAWLFNKRS